MRHEKGVFLVQDDDDDDDEAHVGRHTKSSKYVMRAKMENVRWFEVVQR